MVKISAYIKHSIMLAYIKQIYFYVSAGPEWQLEALCSQVVHLSIHLPIRPLPNLRG